MNDLPDNALLSTAYLPPVDYFKAIRKYDSYLIESQENYQKQSYRNRCCIYSANGAIPLVVPVVGNSGKQPITEVKIDYSKGWQKQHWRAIHSAYKSTPFFDHYQDQLYPFYSSVKEERLFDLNSKLTSIILSLLGLPSGPNYTQHYRSEHPNDFRESIHPKKASPLNKTTQSTTPSGSSGIYHQLFAHKHGFIANLSIIDLIFNEGPESLLYL